MTSDQIHQAFCIGDESLPYTITSYYYKLILGVHWDLSDVWFTCYHLFCVGFCFVSLVIEISKRSAEVKTSIDSSHHDISSRTLNSFSLLRAFGLMILRKLHKSPISTESTSRITSISNIIFLFCYKYHIGGTSSPISYLLWRCDLCIR